MAAVYVGETKVWPTYETFTTTNRRITDPATIYIHPFMSKDQWNQTAGFTRVIELRLYHSTGVAVIPATAFQRITDYTIATSDLQRDDSYVLVELTAPLSAWGVTGDSYGNQIEIIYQP